jgi:hypothetical protein
MPRRSVVLLTPSHYTPDSPARALLHFLCTSFVYRNEAHPLSPQPLPHSYTKTPGCHPEGSLISRSPLGTRHSPLSSFDATLAETSAVTPLGATLTKNWGEGMPPLRLRFSANPAIKPAQTNLKTSLEGPSRNSDAPLNV